MSWSEKQQASEKSGADTSDKKQLSVDHFISAPKVWPERPFGAGNLSPGLSEDSGEYVEAQLCHC